MKDHLGNTRIVVSPDETGNGKPEISQTAHYYPFGMNFQRPTDNHNRRLYNGKELQTELDIDWYNYGARFYDAQIGRFHSVDPLAEKYNFQSPYAYAANNPILNIDFMGMNASPYYDTNGNFLGVDENGFSGQIMISSQKAWDMLDTDKDGVVKSSAISNYSTSYDASNISGDIWIFRSKLTPYVRSKKMLIKALFESANLAQIDPLK